MRTDRPQMMRSATLVRAYALALLAILIITFLPLLGVFVSTSIADAAGCTVNEGGTYPCVVMGQDFGGLLNFLFVAGWLMLLTLPLGVIASAVWLVLLIAHLISRRMKARE